MTVLGKQMFFQWSKGFMFSFIIYYTNKKSKLCLKITKYVMVIP